MILHGRLQNFYSILKDIFSMAIVLVLLLSLLLLLLLLSVNILSFQMF